MTSPFHLDPAAAQHLGFTQFMELLRSLCRSPYGAQSADAEPFALTSADLHARLDQAVQAKDAVARKVAPPFFDVREIRPHLAAVQKGIVLGANDLIDAGKTADAIGRIKDVVVAQGERAPQLVELAHHLCDERRFSRRVLAAFDETGQLKDDASHALASLRARLRQLRAEAQQQLQHLIHTLDGQGYLQDRNFTVRNDRYVLPVRSEVQRLVEGIVHDASQTHQTVYVEPRALLEVGNRIKIAQAEVVQEEEHILFTFSQELAERADDLRADLSIIGVLDAAFARGTYAHVAGATKPRLAVDASLSLRGARHPLLAYTRGLQADAAALVQNDIDLGDARVLVVSGPNGGGKTVALTTAGLIAVLARAGVPVPVEEGSAVPMYACVVCAMSGDQSLSAGLSTFQWHLLELKRALQQAEAAQGPCLCLVDEICSGTDPAEGAALAQAILERLARHARVIVTTHFERLKVLAVADATLFKNASFALHERTGQPTFRLILDQAGTSRALAAARDKGMPDEVIARAEALMSPDDRELAFVMRTLSEQKDAMRARLDALQQERAVLDEQHVQLQKRMDVVQREAQRLRVQGTQAFVDELKEARRAVADAIEATKSGASAARLDKLSHELKDVEQQLQPRAPHAPTTGRARVASVKVGDTVELEHMPGTRMTVVELDGDDVVVAKGALKTRTTLGALMAASSTKENPWKRAGQVRAAKAPVVARAEPRTHDNSLDVRGRRADEALDLVDAFLDRMMKEDRGRAFILHGHGGGALKGAIRKGLASSRYVSRHQPADTDEGGDAWTVVSLGDS